MYNESIFLFFLPTEKRARLCIESVQEKSITAFRGKPVWPLSGAPGGAATVLIHFKRRRSYIPFLTSMPQVLTYRKQFYALKTWPIVGHLWIVYHLVRHTRRAPFLLLYFSFTSPSFKVCT